MKTIKMTIEQAMVLLGAINSCCSPGTEGSKRQYDLPFKMVVCLARNLKAIKSALEPAQEENRLIFEGWPAESSRLLDQRKAAGDREERERITAEHSAAFDLRNSKWKKVIAIEIELQLWQIGKLENDELVKLAQSGIPANLIADLEPIGIFEAI